MTALPPTFTRFRQLNQRLDQQNIMYDVNKTIALLIEQEYSESTIMQYMSLSQQIFAEEQEQASASALASTHNIVFDSEIIQSDTGLTPQEIIDNTIVVPFYNTMPELICPISHEDFVEGEMVCKLRCEHYFKQSEIHRHMERHNTCPVCRAEIIHRNPSPMDTIILNALRAITRTV